jgi:hypothetical protein
MCANMHRFFTRKCAYISFATGKSEGLLKKKKKEPPLLDRYQSP